MKNKYRSKVIIGTWSLSGDLRKYQKRIFTTQLKNHFKKKFFEFDTAPTYDLEKLIQFYQKFVRVKK